MGSWYSTRSISLGGSTDGFQHVGSTYHSLSEMFLCETTLRPAHPRCAALAPLADEDGVPAILANRIQKN